MIITVTCEDQDMAIQFWYVAQDASDEQITIPRSCTRLNTAGTKIMITNFSQHKFLCVRKGRRIGYFKRVDRDNIDMYAVDLAKLGTDQEAFVDLAIYVRHRKKNAGGARVFKNSEESCVCFIVKI
jgi:hypothetical protein